MSYQWVTAKNVGFYPPTGSGDPPWYTPSNIPKAVVRCPSAHGNGDILERVEVAGYWGFQAADATTVPDATEGLQTHLLGDIGSSSSTPPDPQATGAHSMALTAWLDWTWETPTFGDPTNTYILNARASTNGYITSHARRGPESYGGVDPYFVLGIITEDAAVSHGVYLHAQSYWAFYVRCLWRTP